TTVKDSLRRPAAALDWSSPSLSAGTPKVMDSVTRRPRFPHQTALSRANCQPSRSNCLHTLRTPYTLRLSSHTRRTFASARHQKSGDRVRESFRPDGHQMGTRPIYRL